VLLITQARLYSRPIRVCNYRDKLRALNTKCIGEYM
jgi:hypothetical protein